jgi:hypothetical protein
MNGKAPRCPHAGGRGASFKRHRDRLDGSLHRADAALQELHALRNRRKLLLCRTALQKLQALRNRSLHGCTGLLAAYGFQLVSAVLLLLLFAARVESLPFGAVDLNDATVMHRDKNRAVFESVNLRRNALQPFLIQYDRLCHLNPSIPFV